MPKGPDSVRKAKDEPNRSLSDLAYEEIKWRIISDEIKSGVLLTENDLCDITGYGKAPIRSALLELKHDKLVDVVRRKGFFVRPWSADEAGHLLFMRRLIEPALAAEAARQAGPEDIARLEKIVSDARENVARSNRRALIQGDNDFHIAIARASGNPIAAEVVETLKLRSHYLWHVSISNQSQLEAVQTQHEAIFAAIEAHDPEAAEAAFKKHLNLLDANRSSV